THSSALSRHSLHPPPRDRALHALARERDLPRAGRVRRRERLEPLADRGAVLRADEALLLEHACMRDRSAHVVLDEPRVENVILAGGEAQDALVERKALVP